MSLACLKDKWSSGIVSRSEIKNFTGGLLSPGYMKKLDCLGKGPAGKLRIGGKVAYKVDDLIKWMESRMEAV